MQVVSHGLLLTPVKKSCIIIQCLPDKKHSVLFIEPFMILLSGCLEFISSLLVTTLHIAESFKTGNLPVFT